MNCTENKSNKRNDISIAKAIGIILMVAGHIFITNETQPLHDFIYSFHMPLFFILSGFCFSNICVHGKIHAHKSFGEIFEFFQTLHKEKNTFAILSICNLAFIFCHIT